MTAKATAHSNPPRHKVLLVDDHPVLREGLIQTISREPDLSVCGEAENAAQTMEVIAARKPDLVVVDITLPGKSGLELIKDIQTLHPGLPVLVVSMHEESLYAERALRAGARGYIMKQESPHRLVAAIRRVLEGHIYVSEKMSAQILEIFSGTRPKASRSPIEQLSDREFEIFQLIGQGRSTEEIAQQLHLSVKTVAVHNANIKKKLQVKTARELIRRAVLWEDAHSMGTE